jgi:hypothetical protein
MKEQNKYYIYEYTRLDTGEVFYVGKGTTHSIESKKKISLSGIGRPSALRKEIISSEGLIFESITAAAKYYKCLRTSITNILTKRNNSIRNGISFNYYKRGILWE